MDANLSTEARISHSETSAGLFAYTAGNETRLKTVQKSRRPKRRHQKVVSEKIETVYGSDLESEAEEDYPYLGPRIVHGLYAWHQKVWHDLENEEEKEITVPPNNAQHKSKYKSLIGWLTNGGRTSAHFVLQESSCVAKYKYGKDTTKDEADIMSDSQDTSRRAKRVRKLELWAIDLSSCESDSDSASKSKENEGNDSDLGAWDPV